MSMCRDRAHRGSARATVLRTVGTRERRSHLTAPRVPTVGIDIGGTKVMAGGVDADGNILEKPPAETPDQSNKPKGGEGTIVELVPGLSHRPHVHPVGIGDPRCPAGNRGCWEQYSSGNALVREAREMAAADSPVAYGIIEHVKGNIADITGQMITELAREGDAMCIELLQDIGQWLGVGIANLAAALDPSCFVIGGGVSAADDL